MRSVIIIQARMGSSRLPGKVLLPVKGKSLLEIEVERLRRVQLADDICVATTLSVVDDSIEAVCKTVGVPCFRGSEEDVLARFYEAALFMNADEIVRITADCPLIEPWIVDLVITTRAQEKADYASNTLRRTFPRGLDVECFSFQALFTAWKEAFLPWQREHVTPFIYRHPERFSLRNVEHNENESHRRWTVDTNDDYLFVSCVLGNIKKNFSDFNMFDILNLLSEHPEWESINAHVEQKHLEA